MKIMFDDITSDESDHWKSFELMLMILTKMVMRIWKTMVLVMTIVRRLLLLLLLLLILILPLF